MYLQITLYYLTQFFCALLVSFWVLSKWKQEPAPLLLRWVRHKSNLWIALGLALAPTLLSKLVVQPILDLFESEIGYGTRQMISYGLGALYGACYGLAASCAIPTKKEISFGIGSVLGVSAALILVPHFMWSMGGIFMQFHLVIHILLVVIILAVARLLMGGSRDSKRAINGARSPGLALFLGFLPSGLMLGTWALMWNTGTSRELHWFVCVVSVICCFTASAMLFSRRSAEAILGGIAFMLLNAFIAFFSGCTASLRF